MAPPAVNGDASKCRQKPVHANRKMRVITIGAGASGIYMAYKLKYYFTDFVFDVYEKNPDLGGTWFENRYPGCACDVPASVITPIIALRRWINPDIRNCSHNYTYSFEPKSDWSANYATSREIFTYFKDFVEKYGLREYISFSTEVIGAQWDDKHSEWIVKVRKENGAIYEQRCDFLINAAGILNAWRWPVIPGLHSFEGPLLHSAAWDESYDITGKHIGLIGNGQVLLRI